MAKLIRVDYFIIDENKKQVNKKTAFVNVDNIKASAAQIKNGSLIHKTIITWPKGKSGFMNKMHFQTPTQFNKMMVDIEKESSDVR